MRMKRGMKSTALGVGLVVCAAACAGSSRKVDNPPGANPPAGSGGSTLKPGSSGANDGGSSVQPSGSASRPFANDSVEATSMCNDAVDSKSSALIQCVQAVRARRKQEHGKIVFEIGIDQE